MKKASEISTELEQQQRQCEVCLFSGEETKRLFVHATLLTEKKHTIQTVRRAKRHDSIVVSSLSQPKSSTRNELSYILLVYLSVVVPTLVDNIFIKLNPYALPELSFLRTLSVVVASGCVPSDKSQD